MNPLINSLTNNLDLLAKLNNLKNMLNSKNETQLLQNLVSQNPEFKNFVNNMNGKDINNIFEQECRKRGLNSNQILQHIQNILN